MSTETEALGALRQFINDHAEQEDPDGQDLHRRASEAVELLASLVSAGERKGISHEIHDLKPVYYGEGDGSDWFECVRCGFQTRSKYPPQKCPVKP